MKGASVKKVILRFSSGNDPICHSQKFQPSQTPHSHFLPISPRFLENIRCQYFSLNIWVVYDQLKLDWCIFDQNWGGIWKSILEIKQRSGAQWCRKSIRGKYIDIYGAASPSLRCYPPHIWLWNLTHKFQIMKQGNGKSKKCFLSYLVYKYNTNHTLNT